jgi:hypothetical protein
MVDMILLVLKLNECIVQVFCALFSTGGAAGLGYVFGYQLHEQGEPIRKFLYMVDASCGLLLGAAISTVVMIMISVYMK